MEKIESFKINHLKLKPGLYVSRRDGRDGVEVTTFDLRMTAPNCEPPVDMPALHTVEHLAATYLRGVARSADILYFGPMGCRTGCYLVMFGRLEPEDVFDLVVGMCDFVIGFDGEIPGAKAEECGNYLEHNLAEAKYYIQKFRRELVENKRTVYSE